MADDKQGTANVIIEGGNKKVVDTKKEKLTPAVESIFASLGEVDKAQIVIRRRNARTEDIEWVDAFDFVPATEKMDAIYRKILENYGSGEYFLEISAGDKKKAWSEKLFNQKYPSREEIEEREAEDARRAEEDKKERRRYSVDEATRGSDYTNVKPYIRRRSVDREPIRRESNAVEQLTPVLKDLIEGLKSKDRPEEYLEGINQIASTVSSLAEKIDRDQKERWEADRIADEKREQRERERRLEEELKAEKIKMAETIENLQKQIADMSKPKDSLRTELEIMKERIDKAERDKEMELQEARDKRAFEMQKLLLEMSKNKTPQGFDFTKLVPYIHPMTEAIKGLSGLGGGGMGSLKEAITVINSIQKGEPIEVASAKEKSLKDVGLAILESVGKKVLNKAADQATPEGLGSLLGIGETEKAEKTEKTEEPKEEVTVEEKVEDIPAIEEKTEEEPKKPEVASGEKEPEEQGKAEDDIAREYAIKTTDAIGALCTNFRKDKDPKKAAALFMEKVPDVSKPGILELEPSEFAGLLKQIDKKISAVDGKAIFKEIKKV